jgi:hypothetical protein
MAAIEEQAAAIAEIVPVPISESKKGGDGKRHITGWRGHRAILVR